MWHDGIQISGAGVTDVTMAQPHTHTTLFVVSLWCIAFGVPCSGTAGEVYKYVKDGVTHYTNRPQEHVKYVKLGSQTASLATLPSNKTRVITLPSKSSRSRIPYVDTIHKIARKYQISPELVKAIIKVESNYNRRAVSPKGAKGLMQLMPGTAKRFGVTDAFDPEENITGGIKYLCYLFDEFGEHNLDLVLAGYNAGEEAVRRSGNKVPPYRETRKYVKKVKALYLGRSAYTSTTSQSIYRYVDKNGVVAFTNVPRVN